MVAPSMVDLLSKEIPETRSWIEPRVLPYGGIMICAASPKAGKSFIAMELARSIVTGDQPFGYSEFSIPFRGRVLLLDYEVTEGGLQERAAKALIEAEPRLMENFRYVSKDTEGVNLPAMQFSDPAGFNAMRKLIADTKPNVLIIDPIRRALGSWDESKNSDIGLLFQRLDTLIHEFRENNLSIIINHHYRKSPVGQARADWDPLEPDNVSGAGRFFGDVDMLLTCYRDMDDKRYTENGKQYWAVKTRWRSRHAEDPAEMFLTINEREDLRVRFAGKVGSPKGEPPKLEFKPKSLKGEQPVLVEIEPQKPKLGFRRPS